MVLRSALI